MTRVHVHVTIGGERYALPVRYVLEIGAIGPLATAPGASPATLGVRNLRGEVLPVFDLGTILGLPRGTPSERMVVAERGSTRAGFAIDEVTDVEELAEADQEPESELLSGALLVGGELVGVVDVERVFDLLEQA